MEKTALEFEETQNKKLVMQNLCTPLYLYHTGKEAFLS